MFKNYLSWRCNKYLKYEVRKALSDGGFITMIYDKSVNCNWVDTRWQEYSTHLRIKQYTEQHNEAEYTE